ncbi:MAG: SDR family oxidoreductase [Okeania sp. SIO3H1]|uniref:SDR family oxidoreductase n=1 Tax=Okeania sp. SIO1I7 TaxID=2607772 RepID=UPI0013CB9A30|nr:SDR family oxidoreductase [Okeania sp. SIO1I7]NEN88514.1 SDR family oxidoreductase [Okeania sp. SIO3H1]NET29171.1 SDR family oxidoreductase [Okeania sp. SIO1I7]
MKIAIIGCGYVGTKVAKLWSQNGHQVTVTTTTPERVSELKNITSQVVVMKGNDPQAMQDVLQNQDMVLLSVGFRSHIGMEYKQTYLETAQTLVATLKKTPNIQQVIYTSSYSVYGDTNGEWVDENTPANPSTENGNILHETEKVLLSASTPQQPVCILRLGGIYGPGRELIKIFSRSAGKTRPGTGDYVTNWIHLDDIVGAVEFARDRQLQGIYNLVNDAPMKGRELLDSLHKYQGLEKVSWDGSTSSMRPFNARVSNKKLRDEGFELVHPKIVF